MAWGLHDHFVGEGGIDVRTHRIYFFMLALLAMLATVARAGGIPLVDATGAAHGTVKVNMARGSVAFKITSLARLPATVDTFTATEYKAYLLSSANQAMEIYLTDIYPDGRLHATRKVAALGDVSQMGLDRVVVTAFSADGQNASDVLTATIAP